MSFFTRETCLLCPIGVVNSNHKITLFEIRLPEQREMRVDVIKCVLHYMTELRRWFTMTDDRRLQIRLLQFLECMPLAAYNDLKLVDLSKIIVTVDNDYSFFVGNTVYGKDEANDDFCINVSLMLML